MLRIIMKDYRGKKTTDADFKNLTEKAHEKKVRKALTHKSNEEVLRNNHSKHVQ